MSRFNPNIYTVENWNLLYDWAISKQYILNDAHKILSNIKEFKNIEPHALADGFLSFILANPDQYDRWIEKCYRFMSTVNAQLRQKGKNIEIELEKQKKSQVDEETVFWTSFFNDLNSKIPPNRYSDELNKQ